MTDEYLTITGYSRYEVLIVFPHTVRRRSTGRVLVPSMHTDGYYRFCLRNDDDVPKQYRLHKLIADTLIPNPHGHPCIDHVNRDKTDNHLSNLRWVPLSVNNRNIPQMKGVAYTWTDTPPDDLVALMRYNDSTLDRLYFSKKTDTFYTECMGQYRTLVVHATVKGGCKFIGLSDTSGKRLSIYINRVKRQNGIPV